MSIRKTNSSHSQMEADPNGWMTTFGDLIMLLLTFFVLLLTMKSMDAQVVKSMFDDLAETTGPLEYEHTHGEGSSISGEGAKTQPQTVLDQAGIEKILTLMEDFQPRTPNQLQLHVADLKRMLTVSEEDRGVVLSIDADQLYLPGKADIRPERLILLNRIGDLLKYTTNDILIMGHTDSLTLREGGFSSNWELSVYRALSVFFYLTDSRQLESGRVAVGGYGALRPLAPNNSRENRSKNRRVEFVLRPPVH